MQEMTLRDLTNMVPDGSVALFKCGPSYYAYCNLPNTSKDGQIMANRMGGVDTTKFPEIWFSLTTRVYWCSFEEVEEHKKPELANFAIFIKDKHLALLTRSGSM